MFKSRSEDAMIYQTPTGTYITILQFLSNISDNFPKIGLWSIIQYMILLVLLIIVLTFRKFTELW